VDEGKLSTVAASTLASYRKAAYAFCMYLEERGWYPQDVTEWDDLAVEFSYEEGVTVSKMRSLFAALEFVFPRSKGRLQWLRGRVEVMESLQPVRHTVPACYELIILLSTQLASMGRARIGLGLIVQYTLGLRPGELIRLVPNDIAESCEINKRGIIILRLGTGRGTKSGREQFTLLRVAKHPVVWSLLQLAIRLTPADARIFPFTISTYNTWIQKAQTAQGIEVGATAHSPRVGFASDAIAAGQPALETKEAGRWVSESSFRLYVDLVGSQAVAQKLRLQHRAAAVAYLVEHLIDYFPSWALACYGRHAAEGGHAVAHTARGRPRGRGSGRGRLGAGGGVGGRAGGSAPGGTGRGPAAEASRGRGGARGSGGGRGGRGR